MTERGKGGQELAKCVACGRRRALSELETYVVELTEDERRRAHLAPDEGPRFHYCATLPACYVAVVGRGESYRKSL